MQARQARKHVKHANHMSTLAGHLAYPFEHLYV